ncbi:MAG: GTPase HflX [Phycisphaerales bacterium JB039]
MPEPRERTSIEVKAERTVLAAVRLPDSVFDQRDPLGELRALVQQAGGIVVGELEQRRQQPEAGTYMGAGKLEELKAMCDELRATLVVFDHDLSPKQISAIEQAIERKVIDRSELILDIFAGRATTHEAKLQVELAQLEYTYPRLRAMWSHLERIVGHGGVGGIGTRGPGEQQLEIDRRLVQRRRLQLARELKEIQARKRRSVRERRREHFTACLVGYTNAGKSTLFNTLTAGGAYADDRVFATLMTRTRAWDLGGGAEIMLSDTVGFVRDLPHHLVASFRATLEEATHADLLLVMLDVSDPAAELHLSTVRKTLHELFQETARIEAREGVEWAPPETLLLLSKVDRLADNSELLVWQQREQEAIAICALPGAVGAVGAVGAPATGQEALRARVREIALGEEVEVTVAVPLSESRTVHVLESRGEALSREYFEDEVRLRVRIGSRVLEQLQNQGSKLRAIEGDLPAKAQGGWGR